MKLNEIKRKPIHNSNKDKEFQTNKYKHLSTDEIVIILKRIGRQNPSYQYMFEEICKRMDLLLNQFAHLFSWSKFSFDEIYSLGVIGLSKAIDNWDPDRFSSFTTAVYFYIKKEIRRTITKSGYMIRTPFTAESSNKNSDDILNLLSNISNPIVYDENKDIQDGGIYSSNNSRLTDVILDEFSRYMEHIKVGNLVKDLILNMAMNDKKVVNKLFPITTKELELIENAIYEGRFFDIGHIFQ